MTHARGVGKDLRLEWRRGAHWDAQSASGGPAPMSSPFEANIWSDAPHFQKQWLFHFRPRSHCVGYLYKALIHCSFQSSGLIIETLWTNRVWVE